MTNNLDMVFTAALVIGAAGFLLGGLMWLAARMGGRATGSAGVVMTLSLLVYLVGGGAGAAVRVELGDPSKPQADRGAADKLAEAKTGSAETKADAKPLDAPQDPVVEPAVPLVPPTPAVVPPATPTAADAVKPAEPPPPSTPVEAAVAPEPVPVSEPEPAKKKKEKKEKKKKKKPSSDDVGTDDPAGEPAAAPSEPAPVEAKPEPKPEPKPKKPELLDVEPTPG